MKNPVVWFVVGLPGSGKSHFAQVNIACDGGVELDVFEPADLEAALRQPQYIFITHPALVAEDSRNSLVALVHELQPNVHIYFIFFENNLEAAWKGVQRRQDQRNISLASMQRYSTVYSIPDTANPMKIWSPNESNAQSSSSKNS